MANKNGQLKTYREAKPAKKQHTSPCSDCPWARKSLAGWLGANTVDEWLAAAHGDARIDCHTISNQQCAGAAIYRANVCKLVVDPTILRLPADTMRVFSFREFRTHHERDKWRTK